MYFILPAPSPGIFWRALWFLNGFEVVISFDCVLYFILLHLLQQTKGTFWVGYMHCVVDSASFPRFCYLVACSDCPEVGILLKWRNNNQKAMVWEKYMQKHTYCCWCELYCNKLFGVRWERLNIHLLNYYYFFSTFKLQWLFSLLCYYSVQFSSPFQVLWLSTFNSLSYTALFLDLCQYASEEWINE